MQRTRFADFRCSIARTLDVIGEPWSPLILRDVYVGMNRFDVIQQDLGISRKVLTQRLDWLIGYGVLEKHAYSTRPPRYEYRLTDRGWELTDLLLVLAHWGDRWAADSAGPPALHRHHACGETTSVTLACSGCGEPMHGADVDVLPGPGA